MTTKLKRITVGSCGFALAYFGYEYLKNFNAVSVTTLLSGLNKFLTAATDCNHLLALIWLVGIGFTSFCTLFGIGSPELYGIWCVIKAFFMLFVNTFRWIFCKGKNPFA